MSYTADALEEYPFCVEGELEQPSDDCEITFLHRKKDSGVIAPPTRAEWHIKEWIENVQYSTRVNINRRNLAVDEQVKGAQGLGFILPLPGEIGFSQWDMNNDLPDWSLRFGASFKKEGYVTEGESPPETGLEYPTYTVNTRWAVDVPEGYSLLVTTPFFMKPDTYNTMPQVIDADVGTTWIKATMIVHKSDVRIQYSDPFLQVIPFKRDAMRLDAVIDRSIDK